MSPISLILFLIEISCWYLRLTILIFLFIGSVSSRWKSNFIVLRIVLRIFIWSKRGQIFVLRSRFLFDSWREIYCILIFIITVLLLLWHPGPSLSICSSYSFRAELLRLIKVAFMWSVAARVFLYLGEVGLIMFRFYLLFLEGSLETILIFTLWVILICCWHELLLNHDLAVSADLLLKIVIGLFYLAS